MIHEMMKVFIFGPRESLQEIMAAVYRAGVLHIEPSPEGIRDISYIRPLLLNPDQKSEMTELEKAAGLSKKTIHLLKSYLKKMTIPTARDHDMDIMDAIRIIMDISRETDRLQKEKKAKEQELALYARYEKILSALSPLIEMMPESPFTEYTGITLYKKESALEVLENLLERLTDGRFEIYKRDIDEELMVCMVIYPGELGQKIKKIFQEESISELRMPSNLADMPMLESLKVIIQKKKDLPAGIGEIENNLRMLAEERYPDLINCSRIVDERLRQAEISSELYGTRETFILGGWIPRREIQQFRKIINDQFQDMVIIETVSPARDEKDRIPVLLNNPMILRPFEIFTKFLSLPRYGTMDPTPLMAIFFPLFFGLILGDIGYGMILFLVSIWARRRWRGNEIIRDIASVFMVNSIAAVIFGILFGELFGSIAESVGIHPYINRSVVLIPFLIFSVFIGGLHIAVGLLIGVIMAMKRRETKEVIARILKLMFVSTFFALAATFVDVLPEEWRYQIILSGLGIIAMLFFIEKWTAPFDALKLIVNVLSYARIMGFGVASVFLASIANQMTTIPRNIYLGIVLGIFFHLINLIVGAYAPAIQALRLHYVEFFDKFFYPGGVEYRPFGRGE